MRLSIDDFFRARALLMRGLSGCIRSAHLTHLEIREIFWTETFKEFSDFWRYFIKKMMIMTRQNNSCQFSALILLLNNLLEAPCRRKRLKKLTRRGFFEIFSADGRVEGTNEWCNEFTNVSFLSACFGRFTNFSFWLVERTQQLVAEIYENRLMSY